MIREISTESEQSCDPKRAWVSCVLARYGAVPQVARFVSAQAASPRGSQIVVKTERGEELATILQSVRLPQDEEWTGEVLRDATPDDLQQWSLVREEAANEFSDWLSRVINWKLQLELIDLEWTLDRQRIFYVLNDRGAETTRMALLSAAGGFGIVHVQPVTAEGVVSGQQGSGCGSCGCSTESGKSESSHNHHPHHHHH